MEIIHTTDDNKVAGYLTIKSFKNGELIYQSEPMPNKVVSSSGHGRNLITRALAGDTTFPLAITSAALGTSSTAAADGNTNLITPTVTNITITDLRVLNNLLEIDVFVADGNLANNTYREIGFFCGAQLFARIVIAPAYTKVSGVETLFTYTLTLTG
jgi:hypothetical protein